MKKEAFAPTFDHEKDEPDHHFSYVVFHPGLVLFIKNSKSRPTSLHLEGRIMSLVHHRLDDLAEFTH